jgi:hypothetical protein
MPKGASDAVGSAGTSPVTTASREAGGGRSNPLEIQE